MVGQVVAGSVNGKPFDWSGVNGVNAFPASGPEPATGYRHFVRGQIDHQGRFRIDDVMPGEYVIYVDLNPPLSRDRSRIVCMPDVRRGARKMHGARASRGMNYSPEPIDLGTIIATMYGGINPGHPDRISNCPRSMAATSR